MYFTIIGVKKIVRHIEGFVIQRFVLSKFHCDGKDIHLRSPSPIMAGSWFVEFYMSELILGTTSDLCETVDV